MNKKKLVEIARSFSYKLNTGNYESRDFFCSQKAEVPLKDAKKTSEALYQFCKSEVMRDVNEYIKEKESENIIELDKPRKIDFSNLAENKPIKTPQEFKKELKRYNKLIGKGLSEEETEDRKEGMMQTAIDNKQEDKWEYNKGEFNKVN